MLNRLLFSPGHKPAAEVRQWELDHNETAALHLVASRTRTVDLVDDRTWSNLEMERVFAKLDKSLTPLGRVRR
jgi:hypothetical protein